MYCNFRDAGTVTEAPTCLKSGITESLANLLKSGITENLWSGVMKTESRGQAFPWMNRIDRNTAPAFAFNTGVSLKSSSSIAKDRLGFQCTGLKRSKASKKRAFVSPLHRSLAGQTVAQQFRYIHCAASSNAPNLQS